MQQPSGANPYGRMDDGSLYAAGNDMRQTFINTAIGDGNGSGLYRMQRSGYGMGGMWPGDLEKMAESPMTMGLGQGRRTISEAQIHDIKAAEKRLRMQVNPVKVSKD